MAYGVPKVPIWCWDPSYTLSDDQKEKKISHCNYGSSFLLLGTWKSHFWHLLCSFPPLLRLKVPPWSPYGLVPLISCIASPTNQATDLICKFGSFCFIFSYTYFFWAPFFGNFWPPQCLYVCPRSPYGTGSRDLPLQMIKSAKVQKKELVLPFFSFWTFGHLKK